MRWTVIIVGSAMLAACNGVSQPENGAVTASTSGDAERAEIARRASNPDFSAVDALATSKSDSAGANTAVASVEDAEAATGRTLPSTMAVVTDPVSAIKDATEVSARGDDGLKTLPLSPDLLVALRRVESRGEVGNYDHDFLTGSQEPVAVRGLASTSRRNAGGLEVMTRFGTGSSGSRVLVSLWSSRGDGSWQLDDLRAEGTTLSALLASDAD